MGKVIFVILFFAVIIYIVYTLIIGVIEETDQKHNAEVPILREFETKIVYTTNLTIDMSTVEEDCRKRKGTFNTCGTICDVDDDSCFKTCALTCENIKK